MKSLLSFFFFLSLACLYAHDETSAENLLIQITRDAFNQSSTEEELLAQLQAIDRFDNPRIDHFNYTFTLPLTTDEETCYYEGPPLALFMLAQRDKLFEYVLSDKNTNINLQRSIDQATPLHIGIMELAATNKESSAYRHLLENIKKLIHHPHIDLDCMNHYGHTPFILSCIAGDYHLTKLLKDKGADTTVRDGTEPDGLLGQDHALLKMSATEYAALFLERT